MAKSYIHLEIKTTIDSKKSLKNSIFVNIISLRSHETKMRIFRPRWSAE